MFISFTQLLESIKQEIAISKLSNEITYPQKDQTLLLSSQIAMAALEAWVNEASKIDPNSLKAKGGDQYACIISLLDLLKLYGEKISGTNALPCYNAKTLSNQVYFAVAEKLYNYAKDSKNNLNIDPSTIHYAQLIFPKLKVNSKKAVTFEWHIMNDANTALIDVKDLLAHPEELKELSKKEQERIINFNKTGKDFYSHNAKNYTNKQKEAALITFQKDFVKDTDFLGCGDESKEKLEKEFLVDNKMLAKDSLILFLNKYPQAVWNKLLKGFDYKLLAEALVRNKEYVCKNDQEELALTFVNIHLKLNELNTRGYDLKSLLRGVGMLFKAIDKVTPLTKAAELISAGGKLENFYANTLASFPEKERNFYDKALTDGTTGSILEKAKKYYIANQAQQTQQEAKVVKK